MKAKLVYDGENFIVPEEMGKPKKGQLVGTPREQVAELCGRVCYDSLGKGRKSKEYHKHIHEVGHYSVYEHTPITVGFDVNHFDDIHKYYHVFLNRPGIFVILKDKTFRVTVNFRTIIEWDKFKNIEYSSYNELHNWIGCILKYFSNNIAPEIIIDQLFPKDLTFTKLLEPQFEQEKWVTLFMAGSRGFSHEQVRHGDFTAISQRSTRYVDESESDWIWHPLINEYFKSLNSPSLKYYLNMTKENCGNTYKMIIEQLEPWLIQNGIDKFSARKQARGAARGFLGNALETEMMFSASVAQWKHMISMRATKHADAEIRQIYTEGVIPALKQSRYSKDFNYDIIPSDDGIGYVAVNLSEDTPNE